MVITCGDWDLKTMLSAELALSCGHKCRAPQHLRRWINIKNVYSEGMGVHARGMVVQAMLRGLDLKLEGRHHSGIDDCRNIAKVVRALANRGVLVKSLLIERRLCDRQTMVLG